MQQQQNQISTSGQGAQAAAQAEQQTSMRGPDALAERNSLLLKNMAPGTTEEILKKQLSEISVTCTKIFMVTFDKEVCAQICFADYQSLCNAAAMIDKNGNSFTRANNRQKAQFNENTSIFVRNLPEDVTDDDLFKVFQQSGSVMNCQVLRDHKSMSKCMGLVNFASQEAAQNAITSMNNKVFPDRESTQLLSVISYKEQNRMQRGQNSLYQQKTNLFVSGLPNGITEAQVKEMFEQFGQIRTVLVKNSVPQNEMTKHITSLLPIYSAAYVNFIDEEAALAAFAMNKRDPMATIKVAYYEKGSYPIQFAPQDTNVRGNTNYRILFVTKINKRVTEEELKSICAKYGNILQCKLMQGFNQAGQSVSLGKAQVAYSTADEASTAMQKLYFESALGDYIQVDFYKSRELRLEQDAQNSDFSRMLTQYSQRYQNKQGGFGRGGGYQGRGGFNNNQRGYRQGGNMGVQGGAGRYQNQQQNSQYQPRQNRNNNQGGQYSNQQQSGQNQNQGKGQGSAPGQQSYNRGGDRQSRGGGQRQYQFRNNQSQQYPNQRRQYQQNRNQNQQRPQQEGQEQQQRIAFDQAAAFPSLGGGAPTQAPVAMPLPTQQAAAITTEFVAQIGDVNAQKQFLGDNLYGRVVTIDNERAGKVVGMMLESFTTEQAIENLNNEALLKTSVDHALVTIRQAEAADAQQTTPANAV